MRYYIPKGWHFSFPAFPRITTKHNFVWEVKFNNSCKYNIGQDQLDWNKLVGISNHLNPRKDSIRFVWRYDIAIDMFEIGIFIERDKVWKAYPIGHVKKSAKLSMNFYKTLVEIFLNDKMKMYNFEKKNISLRTNPYFGGNIPAPHCMNLKLKAL